MRVLAFFVLSLLTFVVIFWLTWDYRLVTGLSTAVLHDQHIISVQYVSKRSLFSTFEDECEFLEYSNSDKTFKKLDFSAISVSGIFTEGERLLLVFPDSFGYYTLADGKLTLDSELIYFATAPENNGNFVCYSAFHMANGYVCIGLVSGEKQASIYRVNIADGKATPPELISKQDVMVVNLSANTEGEKILVVWSDISQPREISYTVLDGTEKYGGKKSVSWHTPFIPAFHEDSPGLMLRRESENIYDFTALNSDKFVPDVLRFEGFEGTVRVASLDNGFGFLSDGTTIRPVEEEDGRFVTGSATIEVGRALIRPELVVFVAQIFMIALLIAFSFTLVNRGPVKSSGGMFLPSNLVLRFSAFVVDSIITGLPAIGIFLLYLYMRHIPIAWHLWSTHEYSLLQFIGSSLLIIYGTAFEYKSKATPGKMLFGLTVLSARVRRARFGSVLVRNLMKPIDFALAFFLVTPLIMMFTPFNQRLGDLLSQTMVVQGKHDHNSDEEYFRHLHGLRRLKPDSDEKPSDDNQS